MRVVVAGGTFGRIYAAGVRAAGFELAGVLGRGGPKTAALAAEHGVACYSDVDSLPAGIDLACVVVRAGVVGGRGGELAETLLARGVPVLQEQPVHQDELARCLRASRASGAAYRLNSFYPHVAPIAEFLRAAARLRAAGEIRFVDAACAVQVLYPMVDLLGQVLGGLRPWRFEPAPATGPYRPVSGTVAGVPLTLRVQNQIHPADPDNHAHFLHRITVGADSGVLTLADAHGPALWSPRLHVRRDDVGAPVLDGLHGQAVTEVAPAAASYAEMLSDLWPEAVSAALRAFAADIAAGSDPLRLGQYHLTACQVWQELATRLGPPELLADPIDQLAEEISR